MDDNIYYTIRTLCIESLITHGITDKQLAYVNKATE